MLYTELKPFSYDNVRFFENGSVICPLYEDNCLWFAKREWYEGELTEYMLAGNVIPLEKYELCPTFHESCYDYSITDTEAKLLTVGLTYNNYIHFTRIECEYELLAFKMLMVDIDTKISVDDLITQIKSVSNDEDNWLIYETMSGYHVFNTAVYNSKNSITYHPIMDLPIVDKKYISKVKEDYGVYVTRVSPKAKYHDDYVAKFVTEFGSGIYEKWGYHSSMNSRAIINKYNELINRY